MSKLRRELTMDKAMPDALKDFFKFLRKKSPWPEARIYPAEGEVFELTLKKVDPMGMVRRDGYNPRGWKYKGEKPSGVHTRRFMLVSVGYCHNLKEVWEKLIKDHGTPAEGWWKEAFKKAYPTRGMEAPIGFADASWVYPDGDQCFPCILMRGGSEFCWVGRTLDDYWRWVVAVEE